MRLIIREDYDGMSVYAADYVKARINKFAPTADKPFNLGLPTGSSPIGVYRGLVKAFKQGELSFKHVITFNMDEYCYLPQNHPQSYHTFMYDHLFSHVDIDPKNVNLLDGNAPNLEEECRSYEEKIKKVGGIELFLGGIGPDGQ